MTELYATSVLQAYQLASDAPASSGETALALPGAASAPHIYEIAASAYRDILARGRSQSVVINGESGAGKTESCKLILRYLTHASLPSSSSPPSSSSGVDSSAQSIAARPSEAIARKLHDSNPLLEAFGNARTLRNDNSSRFGKFVRLHFSTAGALVGASIERYLLEKSRVVTQDEGERSFHSFYQLCHGADAALREGLRLPADGARGFESLMMGGCPSIHGVDDAREFAAVQEALGRVFGGHDGRPATAMAARLADAHNGVCCLWACLAAVLHLGNTSMVVDDESSQGGGCPAKIDPDACGALASAAALLGVEAAALERALTRRTLQAGTELCELRKSVSEAVASRDALAKAIYERVFDCLIESINAGLLDGGGGGGGGFIGLLDIFGNEVFETNGFEQLLINFANERLQQYFNATAIAHVQAEYAAEGLPWAKVEYKDNSDVVSLLDGAPLSVLSLLDDQCLQAGATDATFAALIHSSFGGHARLDAPRFGSDTGFVVHHYAGSVTYSADAGFLLKNKDSLFSELPELMRTSAMPLLQGLFAGGVNGRGSAAAPPSSSGGGVGGAAASSAGGRRRARAKATQFVSVSAQFRHSMGRLGATLEASQCHFVRCVKPNDDRTPFTLVPGVTLTQLRSCGVLEAVRVSQAGFPTRIPYGELLERYRVLLPVSLQRAGDRSPRAATGTLLTRKPSGSDAASVPLTRRPSGGDLAESTEQSMKARASTLFAALGLQSHEFMLGRTMAFLRSTVLARCEQARSNVIRRAVVGLQSISRSRTARLRYATTRLAALRLERAWRFRMRRIAGAALRRRLAVERDKEREALAEANAAARRRGEADAHATQQAAEKLAQHERAARAAERRALFEASAARASAAVSKAAIAAVLDAARRAHREARLVSAAEAAEARAGELTQELKSAQAERDRIAGALEQRQKEMERATAVAKEDAARRDEHEIALAAAAAAAEARAQSLEEALTAADRLAQELKVARREREEEGVDTLAWAPVPPLTHADGVQRDSAASAGVHAELRETKAALKTARQRAVVAEAQLAELQADMEECMHDMEEASERARVVAEEKEELEEDLQVVQEEHGELERLKLQYEAQLEDYETELSELEGTADELAVARVKLTEAEEQQARLIQEVSSLRRALVERNGELERALQVNFELVERLALSDAVRKEGSARSVDDAATPIT